MSHKIFFFTLPAVAFCILSLAHSSYAVDSGYQSEFKKAGTLYQSSKYEQALEKYQKLSLIEATPEAYYNLGNAYFKSKKLGLAIAAYEKAKRLAPRDADIRKNLNYASSLIQSKISDPEGKISKDIENLFSYVTWTELQIVMLAVLGIIFLWMLLLLVLGRNPFRGWVNRVLWLMFGTVLLVHAAKYYTELERNYGIVIRADAEVRYGTSRDDKTVFRLPEGLKVRLLEERQGWQKVQISSKDSGWMNGEDLAIV
ncbi:MAG: tetratricopeptide repeat protein [Candidatus Omnitrophica bacterium]|nr:tetratricopeptide repeat protein [Candidatus Omnitrophota bacterium]